MRGPDRVEPALDIDAAGRSSRGKNAGRAAGLSASPIPSGHLYQVEFDPPSNPEMATGAEIIGTAFYHAFGYHVVDVYLVDVDAATLTISPEGDRSRMRRTASGAR